MLWSLSVKMVFNDSYVGFVPVFDGQDAVFKGCKSSSCSLVSSSSWNDTWDGHPAASVLLQLAGLTQQAVTVSSDYSPEW